MRFVLILFFLLLSQTLQAKNYRVMVGNTPVTVQYTKGKGKTFVHLHSNEKTALKAAKAVIRKQGGSLITLVHPGGRNIKFTLHRQHYEFDPNRIFTDQGIKKTLTQNGHYSPQAHRQVRKLARQIRYILPKGKVVAVHNNAHYSLKDYLPGHHLAKDAKAMHLNPRHSHRNFYLVTKHKDYKRFTFHGFNSVLQKRSATDDGSLAVLLAKSNYINVEAGYDQLFEQIKMLKRA